MFDAADAEAVAKARAAWKSAAGEHEATYWRQDDNGRWTKASLAPRQRQLLRLARLESWDRSSHSDSARAKSCTWPARALASARSPCRGRLHRDRACQFLVHAFDLARSFRSNARHCLSFFATGQESPDVVPPLAGHPSARPPPAGSSPRWLRLALARREAQRTMRR